MDSKQRGFSVLHVILPFVIVSIIGYTGWYVWQAVNETENTLDSANSSITPALKESGNSDVKDKATTNDPKASNAYLFIKEWGVKFKLSSDIANASYVKLSYPNEDLIEVTTPRLKEISNRDRADCPAADYSSVAIRRAKQGDDQFGSQWTAENLQKIATKLNEYYYFQTGKGCSEDYSTASEQLISIMEEEAKIKASISAMIKTVSKDN